MSDLAKSLPRTPVSWRTGTKGALAAEFAWVQIWIAHDWQSGVAVQDLRPAEEAARWLLVEWRTDGTIKYALSNLPDEATMAQAVSWWKERWQVEQGYRQLKRELGLDHFEGRSWNGFHHHATMTFLAYGFLALEQHRASATIGTEESQSPFLRDAPHGAPASLLCVVPYSTFSIRPAALPVGHAAST